MTVKEQLELINRGVVNLVSEEDLVKKLEQSVSTGKPLRIKFGVDPTSPDIHLGHTVGLRKLRQFQDIGHHAVLIIGDYTALVGDPSGQSKTRPQLSYEEIEQHAQTYVDQAMKVLRDDRLEIVKNGDWFKKMSFQDVLTLASKMTVARMLERDDFAKRYASQAPISVHEFLYPLMQGYDSVMVSADVEIGGTDQTFNLLVGRNLLENAGMQAQCCITTPIIPGLDGVQKMSKSLGNYVGVSEPAQEKFGKIMSIPDSLMRDYFVLLTDIPEDEINTLLSEGTHPRQAKAKLAAEIVAGYDGEEAAAAAEAEFDRVFRERSIPTDIPETMIDLNELDGGEIGALKFFVICGLTKSNGETRRLIQQGGASVDGEKLSDINAKIAPTEGMILRAGKRRFAKIRLSK